jgi:poly-gamma-glutamate synthesis protein (capsule biosynthesis protein)
MCSSFTGGARAGETRPDGKGRPGLNPLRYYYVVDQETLEQVRQMAFKLGWWLEKIGKTWLLSRAGLHMAITRFVEGDRPGVHTVADERDAEGNLRAITEARRQADWVLVHLHNHEWEPGRDLSVPPEFTTVFARACIDAGANVFIGQGSHSLLRGIEIYRNRPIFYDTGDFMAMSNSVTKLPADFYLRPGYGEEVQSPRATTADALDAREALPKPVNPPGGYASGKVVGSVVAVCRFDVSGDVCGIRLYPCTLGGAIGAEAGAAHGPRSQCGIPRLADASTGRRIIEYLGELSSPFGTKVCYSDGIGEITRS